MKSVWDDYKILPDCDVKRFNKDLKENYGVSATGQPYYRLVWSEDMREVRKGDFNYYSKEGLYLGTHLNEISEVRKYDYFRNRYVLEVFTPEMQALVAQATGEMVQSDGYEPLFVFYNEKTRAYKEPVWWAIQYLIKRHREVIANIGKDHRTEEMDRKVEDEAVEKEAAVFMDYLESESSDMMNKFRYQEAVLIHKES